MAIGNLSVGRRRRTPACASSRRVRTGSSFNAAAVEAVRLAMAISTWKIYRATAPYEFQVLGDSHGQ